MWCFHFRFVICCNLVLRNQTGKDRRYGYVLASCAIAHINIEETTFPFRNVIVSLYICIYIHMYSIIQNSVAMTSVQGDGL